jgi:hypothetical protein
MGQRPISIYLIFRCLVQSLKLPQSAAPLLCEMLEQPSVVDSQISE